MDLECPIKSIDLPNAENIELKGLLVVIGANSSGKSQFLHDIDEVVSGRARKLVVLSGITFGSAIDVDNLITFLVERHELRDQKNGEYSWRSVQYGAELRSGNFAKSNLKNWQSQHQQLADKKLRGTIEQDSYLNIVGHSLCSSLFLKLRLELLDSCSNFHQENDNPTKTLQLLNRNKQAKADLQSEIAQTFRRSIWLDTTDHPYIHVKVSDSLSPPSADDRAEYQEMVKYRNIETEGDGLRSYASICTVLLLGRAPLRLIDEPEMCLHPPQAQAMGRFIGSHAPTNACTIVTTHSSQILRGILETNPTAQVARLSRSSSGEFSGRKLAPEILKQATSKPRSRSETILEGLLSNGVLLCEGEGDRIVYEATLRTIRNRQLDIRFVSSEGTGGFSDALHLYQSLNVPRAVIADIDFISKTSELRTVLAGLGATSEAIADLGARSIGAVDKIKLTLKLTDVESVKGRLATLPAQVGVSSSDDYRGLISSLNRLANDLGKLGDFKKRGLSAIEEYTELHSEVKNLLSDFANHGLFLVPGGQLESWVPDLAGDISKERKAVWAMTAASRIEEQGERDDDIWAFIKLALARIHAHL